MTATSNRSLASTSIARSRISIAGEVIRLVPARLVVQLDHDVVHLRGGLLPAWAARRAARVADPDLDVRRGRDPDLTAADVGDRLASGHVRADRDQRGSR